MMNLEAILQEARSLSPTERAELVAILLQQADWDAGPDDVAAGQRGLTAWTESARDESWSEFYPDTLRNNQDNST